MTCFCDAFSFPAVHKVSVGLGSEAFLLARTLGAFPQWRRAVLDAIGRAPQLDDWRAREPHDLGVMLAEMGALVFDGVAFYNALINAEAYLDTAQFPGAQRRLVAVLGYRPRPAVASEVLLAAQADGVRVVNLPAGTAFRTGEFENLVNGAPQLQAPQVFELEQAAQIDPRVNQLAVDQVEENRVPASIEALLAQTASVNVRAGQAVVLALGSDLAVAQVDTVEPERLRSRTPATRIGFSSAMSVPTASTWQQTRLLVPGATTGLWKLSPQAGETPVISGNTLLLEVRLALPVGSIVLAEYQGNRAARRIVASTNELRVLLPPQTSTIGEGPDKKPLVSPPVMILLTRITLDSSLPWSGIQADQVVLHYAMSVGAVPIALGALDHVVGPDGAEVAAVDLGGVDGAEPSRPARGERLGPLARVHGGAVGGHREDGIVGAEPEELHGLHRCQHVADRRETEVSEGVEHVVADAPP